MIRSSFLQTFSSRAQTPVTNLRVWICSTSLLIYVWGILSCSIARFCPLCKSLQRDDSSFRSDVKLSTVKKVSCLSTEYDEKQTRGGVKTENYYHWCWKHSQHWAQHRDVHACHLWKIAATDRQRGFCPKHYIVAVEEQVALSLKAKRMQNWSATAKESKKDVMKRHWNDQVKWLSWRWSPYTDDSIYIKIYEKKGKLNKCRTKSLC